MLQTTKIIAETKLVPFQISDLAIFDDDAWKTLLNQDGSSLQVTDLALSLKSADKSLIDSVWRNISPPKVKLFYQTLIHSASYQQVETARQRILDRLFWELTYWKTPELYETLTEGENLHPGIFQMLKPDLEGKIVLDAGAGSGRASFECLRYGAKQVYAIEPSSGLLNILNRKLTQRKLATRLTIRQGRFHCLPLSDNSVDLALSCSAFTAEPEQGGKQGLAELIRVTRPKGKVVIIWPRQEDLPWLTQQGFKYVVVPHTQEMKIHFRSFYSALRCATYFYHHIPAVKEYLLKAGSPELPFSVLGVNPPHDYCWLEV